MEIIRDLEQRKLPPTCIAVGVFDGVHVGHQAVLHQAVASAREHHLRSAALTFDPHPARVVQPRKAPRLLTTIPERAPLIAALGVEALIIVGFDRAFAALTPEQFARCVLAGQLNARCVVAGEGFRFGRGAAGTAAMLSELGARFGFSAAEVKRITVDGAEVSSTVIRELIAAGNVERAAKLLGRYYFITGPVKSGSRRGRALGFPTANVAVTRDKLLPANGVYAARARPADDSAADLGGGSPPPRGRGFGRDHAPSAATFGADGQSELAVVNIGVRPTFRPRPEEEPPGARAGIHVEAHFPGADPGDLYGRAIALEIVARLRDETRFPGPDALVEQIRRDIALARKMLGRA
jgi:riboflavin kinase/FMN adenylyltransferase